jgi:hypothetical protein
VGWLVVGSARVERIQPHDLAPERTTTVRNGDGRLPLSRYYTKPETYAAGWLVEEENVTLFQKDNGSEVHVLDIPKSRFMRINEIPG